MTIAEVGPAPFPPTMNDFASIVLGDLLMAETETQNREYWLSATPEDDQHPKLLGYAMGYKINKAYYDKAADKATALQDILRMDDAEVFVTSSGYFDNP